jgi:hypothetical protein
MRSDSDGVVAVLLGLCVAGLLALVAGCAPGTDGLRQSCANTSTILADSYRATTALYRADQQAMRTSVTAATADATAARAAAHDRAFDAALEILDAKRLAVETVCSYADVIDGGGIAKRVGELVAQAVQLAAEITQAVSNFRKAVS